MSLSSVHRERVVLMFPMTPRMPACSAITQHSRGLPGNHTASPLLFSRGGSALQLFWVDRLTSSHFPSMPLLAERTIAPACSPADELKIYRFAQFGVFECQISWRITLSALNTLNVLAGLKRRSNALTSSSKLKSTCSRWPCAWPNPTANLHYNISAANTEACARKFAVFAGVDSIRDASTSRIEIGLPSASIYTTPSTCI